MNDLTPLYPYYREDWQTQARNEYNAFFGPRHRPEDYRPVVSFAAPSTTRELLTSIDWSGKTGKLAIETVELQLRTYQENLAADNTPHLQDDNREKTELLNRHNPSGDQNNTDREENEEVTSAKPITSLFDVTAQKIGMLIEQDTDNASAISGVTNPSVLRAMWKWNTVPYTTFCAVQAQSTSTEPDKKRQKRGNVKDNTVTAYERDLDLWILRNEEWLRKRMRATPLEEWTTGLVSLDTCNDVFGGSSLTEEYRSITRPTKMDGFTCLDAKRSSQIRIQPSNDKFRAKFDEMTHGQLEGLEWSNVFVAGGIVLGSLLCVESKQIPTSVHSPSTWEKSDIDIYIYGLNPVEANKKIEHLFHVFEKNIPEGVKDSIIVIKNSRTITFLASYPHRRFQIILKLVKSPAEVLLNFDLDICSMGYDGKKLHMLPRAARALQTGYNVFTMDMVQGHYLGERRASQEQRVFKYANKGYGIRFLPSYVDAFDTYLKKKSDLSNGDSDTSDEEIDLSRPRGQTIIKAPQKPLSMDEQATKARDYFERIFKTYMNWTENGRTLERHYHNSSWRGTIASPPTETAGGKKIGGTGIPVFTHALLDTQNQTSSEPLRRSCLTGFQLFFRHVALWEAEQQERLYIQDDVWASTTYEDAICGISYDDLPCYPWDKTFSSEGFMKEINNFHRTQTEAMTEYTDGLENPPSSTALEISRIVAGKTLSEVLPIDLCLPIWMPLEFMTYANELVKTVAMEYPDLGIEEVLKEVIWEGKRPKATGERLRLFMTEFNENLVLVRLRLTPVMMYQQLDRRLDENELMKGRLYEVIWSFFHAYNNSMLQSDRGLCRLLKRQLSNRALRSRKKPEDEMNDFISWVTRDPGSIAGWWYGPMGQGFWDDFEKETGILDARQEQEA